MVNKNNTTICKTEFRENISKEFESVLASCRAFSNFRTCEIFLSRALQYKENISFENNSA